MRLWEKILKVLIFKMFHTTRIRIHHLSFPMVIELTVCSMIGNLYGIFNAKVLHLVTLRFWTQICVYEGTGHRICSRLDFWHTRWQLKREIYEIQMNPAHIIQPIDDSTSPFRSRHHRKMISTFVPGRKELKAIEKGWLKPKRIKKHH